jgi:hypothetical protein
MRTLLVIHPKYGVSEILGNTPPAKLDFGSKA